MSLGYSIRRAQLLGTASLLSLMLASQMASANPLGGTVEAGSANIKTTIPGTLNVTQSTDKAIINWKSFNIGAGETTRFSLPSSTSVTLNRDFSGDPSKILGNLKSNGRFFLVNRNGILFGKNAHVDVAGLVATTHDIRSQDFLAGKLNFTIPGNPSASVVNHGQITVDDLGFGAFVAPHVRNDGAIVARLGKVALASANGFTLDLYGDNLISFLVENPNKQAIFDENGKPVTALVKNAGKIIADGGQVVLSAAAARGVINDVINTDGIIQANTVSRRGGKIILGGGSAGTVTVAGKVTARGNKAGEKGGKIVVTGEVLHAKAQAVIDVSGMSGGGKLLFGGDYHGGDATGAQTAGFSLESVAIPNAQTTTVEADATLAANAVLAGDGGKVVVWADDHTTFSGSIQATGGVTGGNGGMVETSGKNSLQVTGIVNASAAKGSGGVWLLDPTADVYIINNSQNQIIDSFSSGSTLTYGPIASPSFIHAESIQSALNSGINVTVETHNAPAELGAGAVWLQSNILKTGGGDAKLTFSTNSGFHATTGNYIKSTSGKLDISIDADSDNALGGFIDINGPSSYVLQTNGGSVNLRAWDFVIKGRGILTKGGDVTLRRINSPTTWATIRNSIGNDFVINAGNGNVLLDTYFSGTVGDRIEIGNYAVRGKNITIDAAEVTNIGQGFTYGNSDYSYSTPAFNNADGIGELFYQTISYQGGAVKGTIDGSIITPAVHASITQVQQATNQVNPLGSAQQQSGLSCQLSGAQCLVSVPIAHAPAGYIPSTSDRFYDRFHENLASNDRVKRGYDQVKRARDETMVIAGGAAGGAVAGAVIFGIIGSVVPVVGTTAGAVAGAELGALAGASVTAFGMDVYGVWKATHAISKGQPMKGAGIAGRMIVDEGTKKIIPLPLVSQTIDLLQGVTNISVGSVQAWKQASGGN